MNLRRGSILILTLWTLSFLTIFTVGLARSVNAQLRFAGHLQNRLKTHYLAQAGIEKALVVLEADENIDLDSLTEQWANNEELFKNSKLGDGQLTVSYQLSGLALQPDQQDLDSELKPAILYGVMDEGSKINVNKVEVTVLQSLLVNIAQLEQEQAAEIAHAIIDWRDADEIVSDRGAETDYYQNLELSYPCKDDDFQIPEELLLVKDLTAEIYAQIAEVVTVWGEGKININTVSYPTLVALGLGADLADRIVEYRRGDDGSAGSADDNIFTTTTLNDIDDAIGLSTEEAAEITALQYLLTVKSDVFRITSTGVLKTGSNQEFKKKLVCVAQRKQDEPTELLYWHED
ncbi:general secretion pathway protein GspK [Candidatus Omnitrophota bacterium]